MDEPNRDLADFFMLTLLTGAHRYQHLGTDPRRAAIEAGAGAILADAGARETADVVPIKRGANG